MLMDGIVLRTNLKTPCTLSITQRLPESVLAWKFPPEYAVVKVDNIQWQKGKTGKQTAVLTFKPVNIQGTTISRVSAGGVKKMQKINIHKGDIVSIALKGHAIPVLDSVLVSF